MSIETLFAEMASVPKSQIMLFKSLFANDWVCSFEAKITTAGSTVEAKITNNSIDPLAAVEDTWGHWKALISKGMTELSPTLLVAPESYEEVTQPPTGSGNDPSFF